MPTKSAAHILKKDTQAPERVNSTLLVTVDTMTWPASFNNVNTYYDVKEWFLRNTMLRQSRNTSGKDACGMHYISSRSTPGGLTAADLYFVNILTLYEDENQCVF